MRNFNSHLADDSESTGIEQSVKTLSKTVNNILPLAQGVTSAIQDYNILGLGKATEGIASKLGGNLSVNYSQDNPDGLEYTEESIIKQAHTMLTTTETSHSPAEDGSDQVTTDTVQFDTLGAFWSGGNHPEPHYQSYTQIDESDYNSGYYVLNNYRWRTSATQFTKDPEEKGGASVLNVGTLSMFNANQQLNIYPHKNLRFRDSQISGKNRLVRQQMNPTVRNIVQHPRGRATYNYEDFMYCADLGKISNNHLITLRRFASPVDDNIFNAGNSKDIGHMVCYFGGQDNKLGDIMRMNFHATWKEFKGQWQEVDTNSDDNDTPLGKLSNALSSSYRSAFKSGMASGRGIFGSSFGQYQNKFSSQYYKLYGMYDQNKIYTPKNIVNKTHQYEGMMEFNQTIKLTFRYKMRSYFDVNQRYAFLDLISHILTTTYTRAKFWGGGHWWKGTPQNMQPFNVANSFIDKAINRVGGLWNSLFDPDGGFVDLTKIWEGIVSCVKDLVGMAAGAANQVGHLVAGATGNNYKDSDSTKKKVSKIAQSIGNIGLDILQGSVKNRLGRPQVYALNSILSGAAVGPWHVTIGNPFNPIAAFGNLIIDDVQLQTDGALGIDDFPEELVCIVTLKHAKPRELGGISRMFMNGLGEITSPYSKHAIESAMLGPGSRKGQAIREKAEARQREMEYNGSKQEEEEIKTKEELIKEKAESVMSGGGEAKSGDGKSGGTSSSNNKKKGVIKLGNHWYVDENGDGKLDDKEKKGKKYTSEDEAKKAAGISTSSSSSNSGKTKNNNTGGYYELDKKLKPGYIIQSNGKKYIVTGDGTTAREVTEEKTNKMVATKTKFGTEYNIQEQTSYSVMKNGQKQRLTQINNTDVPGLRSNVKVGKYHADPAKTTKQTKK